MRVQVVMTDAAQRFITPLTFASLTGHKVITGLFDSREFGSHAFERHRTYRSRAGQRSPGDRARHRRSAGASGARTGGRFSHHHVPGVHRPRGAGACDEQQHVDASGHAGKPGRAAPARARHRRAGGRLAGLRHHRPGSPGRAGTNRRGGGRLAGIRTIWRAIWKAKLFSLPPVPRRSRSIRCASFPTVPAARWVMRWPKRRRSAARK